MYDSTVTKQPEVYIRANSFAIKAHYFVKGDSDLLELKSFKGIPIIAPRAFEMLFSD